MWQTVIVKGRPVEMPGYLAERLLRAGAAHLLEVSDQPIPTDSESSGTPTHLGSNRIRSANRASHPKARERKPPNSSPRNVRTCGFGIDMERIQNLSARTRDIQRRCTCRTRNGMGEPRSVNTDIVDDIV